VAVPFQISIPEAALTDLKARLRSTRWPIGATEDGGLALSAAQELARYWANDFDWRRHERQFNELPQFRLRIDEADIHFIHLRAERPDATPLLLLHGWPGSFVEMRHVIPLLRGVFHIVVPSLPGYGFSPLPTSGGFTNARIAEVMLELMTALSYPRFAVQGGDWGAGIGTWMALKSPERLIGLHLNYIPGSYAPDSQEDLNEDEKAFIQSRDEWVAESYGYGHIQRTRPLTLGYGLSDSPAGLAAWIYEKFVEWWDPETRPDIEDILANISVYWFTNTIASSMRLYMESARTPLRLPPGQRITVPTAVFRCRHEAPFPPRSWIERGYDVARWTDVPRGGHFAALEVPELFAADVREFLA
jgi:pimeloyl-ACP methyl ester carboxylesterase